MMWLSQIAQWTGGALHGDDLKVNAVATDTRDIEPGCLFAALRGERFDAHDFLASAKNGGAIAALVEHEQIGRASCRERV